MSANFVIIYLAMTDTRLLIGVRQYASIFIVAPRLVFGSREVFDSGEQSVRLTDRLFIDRVGIQHLALVGTLGGVF